MPTLIKLNAPRGTENNLRVNEDPRTISSELAIAAEQNRPFVVFTNSDSGKEQSVNPGKVISFEAE